MRLLLGAGVLAVVGNAAQGPSRTPQAEAEPSDAAKVAARLQWLEERDAGDEAARRAVVRRFASTPGWELQPCDRYFLATNSDDATFIEGTRRRLEAVRARLVREYPPRTPIGGPSVHSRVVVLALRDRTGFNEYGGAGSTVAAYHITKRELFFHDEPDPNKRSEGVWPGLQSVAAMAYLRELSDASRTPFPEWIVQGIAGRFEALELTDAGRFAPRRDEREVTRFEAAFRGAELLSIEQLMGFSQREFETGGRWKGNRGLLHRYQAAVFLEFLSSEGRGLFAWDARWGEIVPSYVDAVLEGRPADECRARALDGIDLSELEAGWRLWVERRIRFGSLPPD